MKMDEATRVIHPVGRRFRSEIGSREGVSRWKGATQVQWNAGVNPFFSYEGTLTYNGEEEITFTAPLSRFRPLESPF